MIKVEVSTKDLRAGRKVNGIWEPYGQIVHEIYVVGPASAAEEVAARLRYTPDGEEAWTVKILPGRWYARERE